MFEEPNVSAEADSLKNLHYESCRSEGMTDPEIETDWQAFELDYALFSNIAFVEGGNNGV